MFRNTLSWDLQGWTWKLEVKLVSCKYAALWTELLCQTVKGALEHREFKFLTVLNSKWPAASPLATVASRKCFYCCLLLVHCLAPPFSEDLCTSHQRCLFSMPHKCKIILIYQDGWDNCTQQTMPDVMFKVFCISSMYVIFKYAIYNMSHNPNVIYISI